MIISGCALRIFAIAFHGILGGCVLTPFGPVPVVGVNTRHEYDLYRSYTVGTVSSGESIEVGELCWKGVELKELKKLPRDVCLPGHGNAVFLRRASSWHSLSDNPRLGVNSDYAVIPGNFRADSTPLTFLFVQPFFDKSGAGKLEFEFMDASQRDVRTLTLNAPSCGIVSGPAGMPPRAHMIAVLYQNKIYAILELNDINRQTCAPDTIYPFDVGSERRTIRAAVFVGKGKATA